MTAEAAGCFPGADMHEVIHPDRLTIERVDRVS
jgi:hypothetical protein